MSNKLAATLVEELISEGAVKGTFRMAGLVFTPDVFREAQVNASQSFYHQNGYIEYAMLRNWGITQPKAFLQEHCSVGVELESVYAGQGILAEVCLQ